MVKAVFVGVSLFMNFVSYADHSDNVKLNLSVKPFCTIKSYQPMHWSAQNGTFPTNVDNTSGSVTTLCTLGTFYTVGINNGMNYDALARMRRLSNNKGQYIRYAIYSDAGYLIPWQNVGTPYALSLVGTGHNKTNTLYARIPKGTFAVPPGNYQDSLIVNLDF